VRVQLIERKREKARKFHRNRSLKSRTEEQTEDAMNRDKRKRRDDEETSSSFKNERIFDSFAIVLVFIFIESFASVAPQKLQSRENTLTRNIAGRRKNHESFRECANEQRYCG